MQSVQTASLVVPSPWIQICTGNKCHLWSIPVLLFLGESVLADDFKISVTTSPASCHWALHLSFNLPFRHLYLDVLGVPSLPGCPGCLTFKGIPCFSPWQHTLLLAPLCLIHPTIFNEYRSQLTVFKQNKSSVIWAFCSISSFVLFCFFVWTSQIYSCLLPFILYCTQTVFSKSKRSFNWEVSKLFL